MKRGDADRQRGKKEKYKKQKSGFNMEIFLTYSAPG